MTVTQHAVANPDPAATEHIVTVGPMTVDLWARQVWVHGEPVRLTAKEFEVMELLAVRKGTTVTKEMFLSKLYPSGDEPEVKIIDVFICKIRRKLKAVTGGDPLIDTVWGRGYLLADRGPRGNGGERATA